MIYTCNDIEKMAASIDAKTEQKCKSAISQIVSALQESNRTSSNPEIKRINENGFMYASEMLLSVNNIKRNLRIFTQGSYANNTNINEHSDVDIAVVNESLFLPVFNEAREATYGFEGMKKIYMFSSPVDSFDKFKADVVKSLLNYFGNTEVERKNKSIYIKGKINRSAADVVPAQVYRDYSNDNFNNPDNYVGGILIITDRKENIINYPEQHFANGVKKDMQTILKFKKCVRILKNLKNEFDESNNNVSSFGIESLLWNIPNNIYSNSLVLGKTFEDILRHLDNSNWDNYKEINGIKPLFDANRSKDSYQSFIKNVKSNFTYVL